ncbi:helix-turn-helix transcriptional regulator [Mesorhizobium sp. 10J20-29]
MGRLFTDTFDEKRIGNISEEIASAIDSATLGAGSWNAVPMALSKAFPGSFGSLWSMNFTDQRLNFFVNHNIDPDFVQSYNDHFAYINPWADFWTVAKNGLVAQSEEVAPARTFSDTEFYNDWLVPQKDVEAAAALKLAGDRGEVIQFLVHFPLGLSEAYGKAAVEVLTRVRGNLARTIDFAQLMRTGCEAVAINAALVDRSKCAAFVIAHDRSVREANQLAVELCAARTAVADRNGRLLLLDHEADARFGSALEAMTTGSASAQPIAFRNASGVWRVVMLAIPQTMPASSGSLLLLPPTRMALVLVTDVSAPKKDGADLACLAEGFGLTSAEITMCRRLLLGESVADAAEQMAITTETARTRLKTILSKTETARQSQLMLLLSELS